MSKNLDGVLVKRPHSKTHYDENHVRCFARCVNPLTGPLYFLTNFFYIQHPIQGRLKYSPYEFQKGLIDSYVNHRFSINLLSRQTGKTTTAAGYLLWYAMFRPDSTILIAAHKYSGVQEIMQRIRYAYELCPDHIRAGVTSYNKGSMEFDNGSRIVAQATTENTGRGMSITLLYLDEFAFVRPNIAKEFWTSISPTLSTGGGAIITSTPNSDEDQFALLWKGANKTEDAFGNQTELGVNGFKAFSADWKQHPDRDEQWADDERGRIGDERFRREHLNEFLIFDETLIAATTLIDMEGIEPIRKSGQVRWYSEPKPGMIYTVALDPSLGTGGDPAAIQVFEANTTKQVAEWKHNKTPIPMQIRVFADIINEVAEKCKNMNNVYFSIENNTIGEAALISIDEYGEQNLHGVFLSEPRKTRGSRSSRSRKGFNTTNRSKLSACAKVKTLVEKKSMTISSKPLITEFKHFVAHGASFAAKPGETDDLVMALLLTVRMFAVLKDYHKELTNQLRDYSDDIVAPMPFISMIS